MAENKELTAEEQIKVLKAELARERAEKEEQAALIDEQNERLALAEAQKGNRLPVVQDSKKKKYQVLAAKFQHPLDAEKVVKAEDLSNDKELVDLLVKAKSGILTSYVEPSK